MPSTRGRDVKAVALSRRYFFVLTRESLMYSTEARLQKIFNNMSLSKPLMPGEVKMSLHQEKDLGERFYGVSFPSDLYRRKGMNGGINPGNIMCQQCPLR